MVSHKRLQHYKRHYGKTCMTGLYGCRWHRYQQSRDSTSIWDLGWFVVLILTFLFMLSWLCFWITAFNNKTFIHELLQQKLGVWFDWHTVLLTLTSITFSYVTLLLVLGLLHSGCSHEMFMHRTHKVILVVIIAGCVTFTHLSIQVWSEGWPLLYLALLANWPFIHISIVVAFTLLAFLIAKRWMYLYSIGVRIVTLTIYSAVMIFIYVTPLLVNSPCICDQHQLPMKPHLVAHRGGAALAPENTLLAFNFSSDFQDVTAFECDVMISYDGVPFLLHDLNTQRTTDVETVFPDRVKEPAHNFTISDLKKLNAGKWFLERDPFGRKADLSEIQQERVGQQQIPVLEEVLRLVKKTNKSLLFHIGHAPPSQHPYADNYMQIIVNTTRKSGLPFKKVLWPYYRKAIPGAESFTPVEEHPTTSQVLLNSSIQLVNLGFSYSLPYLIREYKQDNISTNVYTVNSWWLFSMFWCSGITSVTTNEISSLSQLSQPIWTMSRVVYTVLWIVVDVVSAVAVIIIFIYNRVKQTGAMFNPETLSLQAMQHRMSQSRQSRNMKEKLLHTAESMHDVENGIVGIVTPTTPRLPSTPGTIETVDTPTTPVTPDPIAEKESHQNGNVSFSSPSDFFHDGAPTENHERKNSGVKLSEIKVEFD